MMLMLAMVSLSMLYLSGMVVLIMIMACCCFMLMLSRLQGYPLTCINHHQIF